MSIIHYFFILCLISLTSQRKINIKDKVLEERSWFLIERYGFYTADESPASHSPGNGDVYWKLNVTLKATNISSPDSQEEQDVYLLYLHSDGMDFYGKGQGQDLCCTSELISENKCSSVSEVYEHKNTPDGISNLTKITLNENTPKIVHMNKKPFKSGIHYVFILNCNYDIELVIDGDSKTLNTYGYLSSELYPFFPFYGTVASLYLLLGVVWVYFVHKFWNQILQLQIYLTWVIVLSMIETATWYFFYLHSNNTGHAHFGAIVFGILISSFKRTISRVLVLVVSMGYGVVKPTLGTTTYKIATIGGLYFIFSGILNILELEPDFEASDLGVALTLFLVIPVAVMDTAFYWWIFVSLLQTLTRLKSRKQSVKYAMYMDFLGVLVASAVFSAVVVIFQLAYVMSNPDDWWRVYWLGGPGFSTAFPVIVYMIILVAISWIWRPVENNTRYAYSELLDDGVDETDFSMQILTAVGQKPQVNDRKEFSSGQDHHDDSSLDLSLGNLEPITVGKME